MRGPLERTLGAACAASGAFIVLLYVGVVPWRRVNRCRAVFCDPYHWQVLCFGLAIAAAGLLFFVPPGRRELGRALALVGAGSFVAGLVGTIAYM